MTGEGARLFGGRWNSPGTAVVYASGTLSLAVLELLANLQSRQVEYLVRELRFDDLLISRFDSGALPADWREQPAPPSTQRLGDKWVSAGASVALAVPSVIVDTEWNYVLNPAHADFKRVKIGKSRRFRMDLRFLE